MKKIRTYVYLAAAALIIFNIITSTHVLSKWIIFRPAGQDFATGYIERFAEIKKDLDPAETVGYITDNDHYGNYGKGFDYMFSHEVMYKRRDFAFEEMFVVEKRGTRNYFIAQYALVPVVVERIPSHAYTVGNFFSKKARQESLLHGQKDFKMIKTYENGMALFKKEGGK